MNLRTHLKNENQGKLQVMTSFLPPADPGSSPSSSDHHSDNGSQRCSHPDFGAYSMVPVVASGAAEVVSEKSISSKAQNNKQSRAKKTPYCIKSEKEKSRMPR
ncbi:MAG: hypothetical protein AB2693_23295, partial [Candidatus Thiodiazotropha sp.]